MSDQPETKLKRGRSPAYPYCSLSKALERAEQLYEARVGQNAYPPGTFYKIWELGGKSSAARQTMAALNHFELVDYEGRGNDRKVRLSSLAIKILQDKRPESAERAAAIKDAALRPSIHKALWEKYPPPLPDDVFLDHFLVSDAGYNQAAASALLDEYKDTLSFANMLEPDNMPDNDDDDEVDDGAPFKVGDFVNWISDGAIQWQAPWKVIAVDKHEDTGALFLNVEGQGPDAGQQGWIPMEQAIEPEKQDAGRTHFSAPSKTRQEEKPSAEGMREDKASLDEGQVVLVWPERLSEDSVYDFEYWVNGLIHRAKRRAGIVDPKSRAEDERG